MINGTLFTEVRQVFANWLTQTIRLAAGAYGCVIGHTLCHRAARYTVVRRVPAPVKQRLKQTD